MEYKENFQITDKETGKVYWISRSLAVCGIIVAQGPDGKLVFLVEKRGPGCPDFIGYYCNPCGYLGWGETREEAVLREIYEETGLDFRDYKNSNPGNIAITEWNIEDRPEENIRQNITTRYIIRVDYSYLIKNYQTTTDTSSRGGEAGEIDELRLVSEDRIDDFEWAWNHGELLKQVIKIIKK